MLIIMLAALTAGILLSHCLSLPAVSSLPFLLLSPIAFLRAWQLRRTNAISGASRYSTICAVTLLIGLGIFSSAISRPVIQNFTPGDYRFSGRVIDYTTTGSGDRTLLEVYSLERVKPLEGQRKITLSNVKAIITISDVSKISFGDLISGEASLNSIDAKGNVRNDDYVAYQKSKGILLKGFSNEDSPVTVTGRSHNLITPFFRNLRENIEVVIEKSSLSRQAKGFLISVGLGDRTYLPEDDRQAFTDGGVAHIFAVSGMHVGLTAGFILAFLSLIFFDERRKWKFIIAIPLIWFYVMLAGAAPATVRAGAMLTIALSALFLQRKSSPLMALGWATFLILAIYPSALFDVGFQLSVVCVGSLIMIVRSVNFVDHRNHPQLYFFVSIILVTLTATFSSWAICAYYFHRLSVMFLPANVVAVPLLPLYLGISAIYILLCACGLDIHWIGLALSWIYDRFLDCVNFFNSLTIPIENIHIGWPVVLLWIGGITSLGIVLTMTRKRMLWIPISLLLCAVAIIPFSHGNAVPDGFIIQKNSDAISLMAYSDGTETQYNFSPGTISSINLSGKRILAIDRGLSDTSGITSLESADIIILCAGIGKNIVDVHETLLGRLKPGCEVVIHPSVHWRYERKLRDKELTNHHSLRYDGPLHFFPE